MAAEDVTADARVYDEGRVAGDGYSGYHRTFQDVMVGGSHLVRLRAETQLYDTQRARSARTKFVDRAGGRQVYAKGVVQAFARNGRAPDERPRQPAAKPGPRDERGSSSPSSRRREVQDGLDLHVLGPVRAVRDGHLPR